VGEGIFLFIKAVRKKTPFRRLVKVSELVYKKTTTQQKYYNIFVAPPF